MRSSSVRPESSNRQSSTLVAFAENSAKLTPKPSQVAPRGLGEPSLIRDLRMAAGMMVPLWPRIDVVDGPFIPDNSCSGGKSPQQIADPDRDECRGDRLILDHVAEPRDLLLRLTCRLVIHALRLRLGVACEVTHFLLHAPAHFAGSAFEPVTHYRISLEVLP